MSSCILQDINIYDFISYLRAFPVSRSGAVLIVTTIQGVPIYLYIYIYIYAYVYNKCQYDTILFCICVHFLFGKWRCTDSGDFILEFLACTSYPESGGVLRVEVSSEWRCPQSGGVL